MEDRGEPPRHLPGRAGRDEGPLRPPPRLRREDALAPESLCKTNLNHALYVDQTIMHRLVSDLLATSWRVTSATLTGKAEFFESEIDAAFRDRADDWGD